MSRREYFREENRIKNLAVVFSIVLMLTVVAFVFIFNLYNKRLQEQARNSLLELGSINAVVPNRVQAINQIFEEVSFSQDRGINEVEEQIIKKHDEEKIVENIVNSDVTNEKNYELESKNSKEKKVDEVSKTNTNDATNDVNTEGYIAPANESYEPSFIAPISGEIIKDFSNDNLIYSKTLDEWTTHYGIDIRADKMAVVVASESGIVESIKNDPRYGLTITIAHSGGYKTIYANLLSSEFVKEGDNIEKGQTIGTVGESASFEVADDPHLHFELLRNGEFLNPTVYLR